MRHRKGQSLVEFTLIAPVLVLIMVATFYVARAIMIAQQASDDIQKPTMQKKALANILGRPANTDFDGSAGFDSFQIVPGGSPYVPTLLVGTKSSSDPLLGTLTYSVAAPINRPLLDPASNPGAVLRPTTSSALGMTRTCPDDRAYISHLYRTLLDREPKLEPGDPERGWVDDWANTLRTQGVRATIKGIVNSQEFQDEELSSYDTVIRLYHAMHMRNTDPNYADWAGWIDDGTMTVDEVIEGMYASAEYQQNIAAGLVPPCKTQ